VLNRILITSALTLLYVASALAADVSGIWSGTLTDRNNDPQDLSFRFIQKGETLTGKMYGDNESTTVSAAKMFGNEISFLVTTELNGQVTTFKYTGTVDGDQMELTRKRVDAGFATSAANTDPKKPATPQTVKLKRLS
jgi:hypothetical protein